MHQWGIAAMAHHGPLVVDSPWPSVPQVLGRGMFITAEFCWMLSPRLVLTPHSAAVLDNAMMLGDNLIQ